MPDYVRFGLVALVVFLTHFQNGVTGFGSAVLALPFLVVLIGLNLAVPALLILGWLMAVLIVIQSHRQIVWTEYAKIVVLAGIGVPIGVWLSGILPENALKLILALFMVAIGIQGLIQQYAKEQSKAALSESKKHLLSGFVPVGGIMQGAFGTGGPIIVIYAAKTLTDKGVFRVTLCLIWATMNPIVLGTRWAAGHPLNTDVLRVTAICLVPMILGLILGNVVHHKANPITFRRVVYAVLVLSGFMLAYPIIPKVIAALGGHAA